MKLISWNVRGIQSRNNDGTLNEIFQLNPDIFCIQELHQKPEDLSDEILYKDGYKSYFYPAKSDKSIWGVQLIQNMNQ